MFLKILTWGKNPIVLRLKSFTFLKIFVFILTKLYINVYILSVIVKSLMFQLVVKDQMIVSASPDLEQLFSFYYRGLDKKASVLTFDEATLYIPLLISAIWLVPTLISALIFSLKLNSSKSWSDRPVLNILLFIFSVVTNIGKCVITLSLSEARFLVANSNSSFYSRWSLSH